MVQKDLRCRAEGAAGDSKVNYTQKISRFLKAEAWESAFY